MACLKPFSRGHSLYLQVLDEVCDISVVKFFRHSSKLLTNGAKELVS